MVDGAFALVIIFALALHFAFHSLRTRSQSEPCRRSLLAAAGMVLHSDLRMAEILARFAFVLGVVVVPSLVAFFFASLPFLDKSMERRPWKRPFAIGCYVCIFLALFGLGALSYHSDHGDAGYDAQLTAQAKATDEFMKQPFQEEVVGGAATGGARRPQPIRK